MSRFDFAKAVHIAMTSAPRAAAPNPEPAHEQHGFETPPPQPRKSLARRIARRFAYPLAAAVRGFFTSGVEARFDGLERKLGPMLSALEAAQAGTAARLDFVATRLAKTEATLETIVENVQSVQRLQAETAAVRAETAAVRADNAALRAQTLQILQLLSAFGPRFDELELKIRPLFRFDDGAWAVRFADGYVLAPGEDPTFALMLTNATSAGFEPGLRAVLSRLVEPGMRVADVGANIGLISLALARLCGPSGQVHSFEPEPKFRALLERTLALNGLSWVKLSPFAAGRAVAKTTFHVSTIPGHSSLYPLPNEETAHDRAFAVDVAPLDAVLGTDAPLDVVKIDVEGAELDVLAGMSAILAANADIALLAEFGPSHLRRIGISPREWFDAFAAEGFDAFEILEPSGAVRPADVSYLQDVSSANIAFARPGGRAHAKIVGAS